jgi:60 kDa SS-A/Ro ribonucleoprotein
MANKNLFKSVRGSVVAPANTVNEAGGVAYSLTDKAALAQYLVTGTFSNTYYATAETQLEKVQALIAKVDSKFLAQAAIYAAEEGRMKDMPAFAAAHLAGRGETALLTSVFDRIMNPKRLYNFVQIIRSGVVGRKSFGTAVKRLILNWLENRTDEQLFLASIGHANPSLADVIKMVHPRPASKSRNALYGYLLGKDYNKRDLPLLVRQYEAFKAGNRKNVPDLPFMVLSNLPLTEENWASIAMNAPWNTLRMNLNNFARHGVFNDAKVVNQLATKLADANEVRRSGVFPYQIMTAYQYADGTVPMQLTNALQDAMETAVENVPTLNKKVLLAIDVSGSMGSAITGNRPGATSKMRCVDVAALIASTIIRKNPTAEVYAFDTGLYRARLNPRDSIVTNAASLAQFGGGGTNCSLPLQHFNQSNVKADLIIYVSDNMSWADFGGRQYGLYGGNATGSAQEWSKFKSRNQAAKLVLIDLQPYDSTQVKDDKDVLNIGGFSDSVFDVIASFVGGNKDHFVDVIEKVKL